jgi:mRNA-degrading endonuclease RelE of RelBE toxin-antitoxin system
MDKISKQLDKLTDKEKHKLLELLNSIKQGKVSGLDLKKLKDRQDLFRVRKGDFRIIFRISETHQVYILALERRSEDTYK